MTERRRLPRFNLRLDAQIFCPAENIHWNGCLTDISDGGCFIEMLVSLPLGSAVVLKVKDGEGQLELPGKIVYGQTAIGSAIQFDPLEPHLRSRLLKFVEPQSG